MDISGDKGDGMPGGKRGRPITCFGDGLKDLKSEDEICKGIVILDKFFEMKCTFVFILQGDCLPKLSVFV